MIHIKIHDTIVDIVEKIEKQTSGDIILDFPLGHPILHNYISLKILKSKVHNRKFIIVSNDRIGKKIGKDLGIEYSLIKNQTFLENSNKNTLLQHNFTFWEFFKFQIHSYFEEIKIFLQIRTPYKTNVGNTKVYSDKVPLHFFITILLAAFILFIFIYYFAISKSYVYISPEIIIKKEAHNFIFKESLKNNTLQDNKYIKISSLELKIDDTKRYASTGINSEDYQVSRGKIRIYNLYPQEQTLIASTRVQTSSGVVFEIPNGVKIPAGVKDNFGKIAPGVIEVIVQAKIKDSSGAYTGLRGNIKKNTVLFIPGLNEDEQKLIYARSIYDFTGGSNDVIKIVSEEDIERAQLLFTEELKDKAIFRIKDIIHQENIQNNSQIDILSGGKSIIYSQPQIQLENGISPGVAQDNFQLSGSINIQVYTYNRENVIQRLKTIINERSLSGVEKVSHIDTSSLRMSQMIYSQKSPFEMKATYEIEVSFFHDFLHQDNTYTHYLASKIRGIPKKDAEKILLNDPMVSNVEIELRPFFSKNISNILQNIIFKVR